MSENIFDIMLQGKNNQAYDYIFTPRDFNYLKIQSKCFNSISLAKKFYLDKLIYLCFDATTFPNFLNNISGFNNSSIIIDYTDIFTVNVLDIFFKKGEDCETLGNGFSIKDNISSCNYSNCINLVCNFCTHCDWSNKLFSKYLTSSYFNPITDYESINAILELVFNSVNNYICSWENYENRKCKAYFTKFVSETISDINYYHKSLIEKGDSIKCDFDIDVKYNIIGFDIETMNVKVNVITKVIARNAESVGDV